MVQILIENGASLNMKDITKNKPIHYASDGGNGSYAECLEILVQHGAYLESRGVDNLTPLQMATDGKYKATAQLLLHYGANRNIKDNFGLYPIEQAMANEVLNSFKLLAFFNQN